MTYFLFHDQMWQNLIMNTVRKIAKSREMRTKVQHYIDVDCDLFGSGEFAGGADFRIWSSRSLIGQAWPDIDPQIYLAWVASSQARLSSSSVPVVNHHG